MASKTISVTEEVYQMLKNLKLPHESFGDIIKKLCEEKTVKNLLTWIDSDPLWSDMSDEEFSLIKKNLMREQSTFTPTQVDF